MTQIAPGNAYTRIREAIVEGRYRPGTRLIEQRLAADLNLSSRTPVREALRALEAEGLVVIELNRGAVVRPIALSDIDDLYELRARLESYAAYRASRLRTELELAAMEDAIEAFERAIPAAGRHERAGLSEINASNTQFHQAISAAAHHERLGALLRGAIDVPLVFQAFRHFDLAELHRSNTFHRLIRDAIAAGDGLRAERLMAEHVDQGRDSLLARLASSGSIDVLFEEDGHALDS
jgi:DNA-binding GntR family transcriptional regulator